MGSGCPRQSFVARCYPVGRPRLDGGTNRGLYLLPQHPGQDLSTAVRQPKFLS